MRILTVATTLMLMACAVLASCGSPEEGALPSAVTTAVSRDFNLGDALGTAGHYADDAQILPPRHPAIAGKPAIAAFFQANIDKYISFGNDSTWSVVKGNIAIEQGTYIIRNVRVGENVEAGKYIRVWKKINGGWKLYRDMFSPDSGQSEVVSVSPEEAAPSASATAK
jgi:ketosteroid isomerase-like protein